MPSVYHTYRPPRQNKAIEAVRDFLYRIGWAKPADRPRFLTANEIDELKNKWRACKSAREFSLLAKWRPYNATYLQVYETSDRPMRLEECIKMMTKVCLIMMRELMENEGVSSAIRWPSHMSQLAPSQVDELVFVFVELSKVSDRPSGSPDPERWDEYFVILRRTWPQSRQ